MYAIEYKKDGKLIGTTYLNPLHVVTLTYTEGEEFAYGRMSNGSTFSIAKGSLEDFKSLVDKASGGGSGHEVSELPKPHPTSSDGFTANPTLEHLSDINENIEYIWMHTKDGKKIKLTKEELMGSKDEE